jgi:transposase, IS30 family
MAPSRHTKLQHESATPTRNISCAAANPSRLCAGETEAGLVHEQKDEKLWEYLSRSHKKRRRWLGRRIRSVQIPHRGSIRHRPGEIGNREEFGHWEGDTIVGDGHKTGIHTEVERVSRLVFAYKVPKIRAKETSVVQLWLFSRLPKLARQSTTLDNGSEPYLHTCLQEELGMQTYFADPYCSWQRGTNESTNGLIRRYFPKGTDFSIGEPRSSE